MILTFEIFRRARNHSKKFGLPLKFSITFEPVKGSCSNKLFWNELQETIIFANCFISPLEVVMIKFFPERLYLSKFCGTRLQYPTLQNNCGLYYVAEIIWDAICLFREIKLTKLLADN